VEPDDVMNGPTWPPEWKTGWFTFRYSDIVGNSPTGNVVVSNSARRAVAKNSHTTVIGGSITVPVLNGVPGSSDAQENADGIMCVEFPIGTDPDVVPTAMQIVAQELFSGASAPSATIYATLTEEHTLDNPLWLTDDLTTVRGQAGVIEKKIWEVANENLGIPTAADVGDYIFYVIPGKFTKKTGA
jgi:hypothetical protein